MGEVVGGRGLVIGANGGDGGGIAVGGLELVTGVEVDGVEERGAGEVVERVVLVVVSIAAAGLVAAEATAA
jgi:hypothetical protein